VRVTVPRALPTDDVLLVRERRPADGSGKKDPAAAALVPSAPWKGAQRLEIVGPAAALAHAPTYEANGHTGLAVVCARLDEVQELAVRASVDATAVRAVLAPFIPSHLVGVFSGVGIAAIQLDGAGLKCLESEKTLALPAPSAFPENAAAQVAVGGGGVKVPLTWLALGAERTWAGNGAARSGGAPPRSSRAS
jgi:aconitate hydratase